MSTPLSTTNFERIKKCAHKNWYKQDLLSARPTESLVETAVKVLSLKGTKNLAHLGLPRIL